MRHGRPLLEPHEVWLLVGCSALGLAWTFVGLVSYTLNVPPPTFDPGGLVRLILLGPLYITFLEGALLNAWGLVGTDPLGAIVLCGTASGLLAGLLGLALSRLSRLLTRSPSV